jgi:hypothetical protein
MIFLGRVAQMLLIYILISVRLANKKRKNGLLLYIKYLLIINAKIPGFFSGL